MSQERAEQPSPYAKIIAQTEDLLSNRFGCPLSLTSIRPIQVEGRFLLLRCQVEPSANETPTSVIIKCINPNLPAHKRLEVAQTSSNEQAVLQMLTDLSGPHRHSPHYYAGDHLVGLLLLQDLGDYPTLQELLYGQNAQQAHAALVQYGRYLARMQLATRAQAKVYRANLQSVGAIMQWDVLGWDLRNYLPNLHGCLRTFQIEATTAFDEAIDEIARTMQEPGPFYALSHCDAGPHNIMVLPEQSILIDFESACFQHGFVDLVQARMAFPSAGLGRRSPQNVVAQMELAYREELVKGIPEVAEDQVFKRALVQACAQVLLTMIAESWQGNLSQWSVTAEVTPASHFRIQRLITFAHAFLQAAEAFQQLPYLHLIVQKLYDSALNRWPEVEILPHFPVVQVDQQD